MSEDPRFSEPEANRAWSEYFRQVDRLLKPLVAERRDEIREELVAHVLDGVEAESGASESEGLARVLARLGPPSEFLGRLVGAPGDEETHSTAWRLSRGLTAFGRTVALGACYLIGMAALLIAVAKPIFPSEIGLYRMANGWWMMGYVDSPGAREVLGYWIVPLMLGLVYLTWFLVPRRLTPHR